MTVRIGSTSSTWKTLTSDDHLFIRSGHLQVCAASWSCAGRLVEVILAVICLLTLGFIERLASFNLRLVSIWWRTMCACVGNGSRLFLEIDLTVALSLALSWKKAFTRGYLRRISNILLTMGTYTRSSCWFFHEVQNTVLSEATLSTNSCRSVLASSYSSHIVAYLWNVRANSRSSAWCFFIVYRTLRKWVTFWRCATFTSVHDSWITFISSLMSTRVLGGVGSFNEVKLAVLIAFTSCFVEVLAFFNFLLVSNLIYSVCASSWGEILFGLVV